MVHTDEFVSLGPAFNGGRQKRMTETESGRCESVDYARIDVLIISVSDVIQRKCSIQCIESSSVTFSYPFQYPSFSRTKPNFSITSLPNKIGKNSLYVTCWIMPMLMRRASWKRVSSSQCGFTWAKPAAKRLCSRAINVCMQVRTSCSLTRISPGKWDFNVCFVF